jgi:hypothetical protein
MAIAATIGPAAALVGIQCQLAQIASLVRKNIAATTEVLAAVRAQEWSELSGLHASVMQALLEAQHVQAVTPAVWASIAGKEDILRKNRDVFRRHADNHLTKLLRASSTKERHEWLQNSFEAVLADAQGLLMAQQAWFTYQGLRVAHLLRDHGARSDGSGGVSPHDEQLAELIAGNASSEHRVALVEAEELLKALSDRFGLMGELPPQRQGDARRQETRSNRSEGDGQRGARPSGDPSRQVGGRGPAVARDPRHHGALGRTAGRCAAHGFVPAAVAPLPRGDHRGSGGTQAAVL